MCKLNDDALQVTEQILPYFQPAYNLTVNLVGAINEKRDIPIVLENITMQDDYEGDFTQQKSSSLYFEIYCKDLSIRSCFYCYEGYHQKGYCYISCWWF